MLASSPSQALPGSWSRPAGALSAGEDSGHPQGDRYRQIVGRAVPVIVPVEAKTAPGLRPSPGYGINTVCRPQYVQRILDGVYRGIRRHRIRDRICEIHNWSRTGSQKPSAWI